MSLHDINNKSANELRNILDDIKKKNLELERKISDIQFCVHICPDRIISLTPSVLEDAPIKKRKLDIDLNPEDMAWFEKKLSKLSDFSESEKELLKIAEIKI